MLATLLVLVVFLTPHPSPTTMEGFEDAALQLMAEGTGLTIKLRDGDFDDAEAMALGPHSDGIVQLRWSADGHEVSLRAYFSRDERWVERRVAFKADDPEYDRGRLVGFVVASMFVGLVEADEQQDPAPPEAPLANDTKVEEELGPATSAQRAVVEAPLRRSGPDPIIDGTRIMRGRHALEFSGIATKGFSDNADTWGARVAVNWKLQDWLYLRPTVAVRVGEMPEAEATSNSGLLGLGLGLPLLPSRSGLNVELRATVVGGWLAVTHFSGDDPKPVRQVREQVGAELLATLRFGMTDTVGMFASAGAEAMVGRTDVYTDGQLVSRIPRTRGLVELGVRTEF